MPAFIIFTLFLLAALLASALLHYPLYSLLGGFFDAPPHKLIPRVGKLLALPAFFLLLHWMALYSREALGYTTLRPLFLRQMAKGWLMGILILILLAATLFVLEVRIPDPLEGAILPILIKTLVSGLIAGLLVALIEETFFRGAMFQAIRRNGSAFSAITLTSLLYAAVHFIKPQPFDGELSWLSGLQILAGSFWQFGEWATFDSFLALFAVGFFLGLVREYTGGLAYCMGLHAGWVMVIKCFKEFTDRNPTGDWSFLVGNYDGITGYLAAIWISLLALFYWLYQRRKAQS